MESPASRVSAAAVSTFDRYSKAHTRMTTAPASHNVLRIDNLALHFISQGDVVEALKGISLDISAGEVVGVVGESGSGKSVTALNILRLLPRSKIKIPHGTVSVLDRDVLTMNENELRKIRGGEVSMIFQEPMTALNPVLRVREQMFDVIMRHQKITPDEAAKLSLQLLSDMKIQDPERVFMAYPHELSGGMRQRVMIAMAFSCQPKLILADEPTTALDVTVQAQILNLLKERATATRTAVMLITHDLAVVAQLCNRVYVMYKGKIVEHGKTRDVIGKPQHAYTKALLNALPEGKQPKSRLETVAAVMIESATGEKPAGVKTLTPLKDSGRSAPQAKFVRFGRGQPIFEAVNATVRYPKKYDFFGRPVSYQTAVDHVNLSLFEGETLSIVGESGCGKTSFANTVVGLASLAEGQLKYKGKDLKDHDEITRREIQIVFQDPQSSLDPRWPIWRIMTEPLTVGKKPSKKQLRDTAEELCEMVGLDPHAIDRLPHEFSGGQRQRIAIGRALSVHPRLLLLDEPTSALDVSVQAQILNLLLDLQDKFDLSYLFISHNVAVVRHISDRVAVMHMGKIVESGAADQVLSRPAHAYTRTLMDAVPTLERAFAAA
ncbi:MAG: ABC transporter ATP-binding protein [Rhodospirillaceae bacterium]|nr:ABC transporter ATP-binding protein [Rhodospirillaceae bacterium]